MTKPNTKTAFGIPYQSCDEIRASFINFFQKQGHKFVPSSSIAPQDDPSLLFTNSGMNQFKAIFLGDNREGLKRAVNSQKCLRVSGKHNDLDEVGRDGTHHTFFEMLGNWSFGDYYKQEAISWAWQLLTEVWKFPKDRLFVTVYRDDDEAEAIWRQSTDIAPERILRFTEANFWEMGPVGPCGPCSEIHFDLGDLATQKETYRDPVLGVNGSNQRYIEIWNLVFMQYERRQDGSLAPLKARHVDTGSGFERMCAVIQGKTSTYETDVFQPLIAKISQLSHYPYHSDDRGVAHRVIADHIRALAFAIADGVTPGNEGRGYVMRRILRRACRFAHQLGQKEPMLYKLVPTLCEHMGQVFPELKERQSYIGQVIAAEEERFLKTLDQGLQKLDRLTTELRQQQKAVIPGHEVFLFHDTFGFPYDLTQIIAAEKGLSIDSQGFQDCMEEQKERARKAAKFDASFMNDEAWTILSPAKDSQFVGYDRLTEQVHTLRYREEGDFIFLVSDKSPFYAEAGGQIGDTGLMQNAQLCLRVIDTVKILDTHVHKCTLVHGLVQPEHLTELTARVDEVARERTRRNHSATHLLHAALRRVLGEQVQQQGSHVGPERLRFDFTHHRPLQADEWEAVENLVNERIQRNEAINTAVLAFDDAKKQGAMALFGEKYGDKVRVLRMGDFSKELCGGTHAQATGELGMFRIISESSIAAGIRRIEAVSGWGAIELMRHERKALRELADSLKSKPDQLLERINALITKAKEQERELASLQARQMEAQLSSLIATHRRSLGAFSTVICSLSAKEFPKEKLQQLTDSLASKLSDEVAFLTQVEDGQLSLIAVVGKQALASVKAGELMQELSLIAGGRGGGRADRARAGSKFPEKEQEVLKAAEALLTRKAMANL